MDGIHDLLIGCSGLYQVYDDIGVLAFTLMLTGQLAPFQEGIRIIDAGMALAGAVHIVIGTVRLLVVLLAVFQDIGPIFGRSSTSYFLMGAMEFAINRRMMTRRSKRNKQMGVICALRTDLITETPVEDGTKLLHFVSNHVMGIPHIRRIVESQLPFPRLRQRQSLPNYRTTKLQKFRGVILDPRNLAGLTPGEEVGAWEKS